MKTLEQYLLDGVNNKTPNENVVDGYTNIIDHALRCDATGFGGHAKFYIHPAGKDGETLSFWVVGNTLVFEDGTGSAAAKRTDIAAAEDQEKNFERYKADSEFLAALKAAGVDNWEGYSEAVRAVDGDD